MSTVPNRPLERRGMSALPPAQRISAARSAPSRYADGSDDTGPPRVRLNLVHTQVVLGAQD